MKNNTQKKINLILVHGTWSPNAAWIQDGSALREAIKQHCPECELPTSFVWSGANSVTGRKEATEKLIKKIEENKDQKNILIAHSHGGNVALQALHGKIKNESIQNSISGVVCLNTPFFTLLRKDTQHMAQFAIVSLIMFLGFAFWYPIFIRDDLPYWPIWPISVSGLLYLIFSRLTYENFKNWIDNRWLVYKRKFQSPRVKSIPFLCLNSGADEAFTFLSVVDGICNIPSILFTRYGSKIMLTVFFFLILLHKISIYFNLFSLQWIKSIEDSCFRFCLVIFKVPDLKGLGFDFSPHWPIIASLFEAMGLAALYSTLFVLVVVMLAVTLGLFSRATTGTWKAPMMPLFVRQFTSLTPILCEKVEFYQYDASDDDTALHSSLYNDPAAIDHIVKWINTRVR